MKKRMITLFLAVAMTASLLAVPAEAAAGRFSDVSDSYTATAIETLRLMGVLDGYPDGSFQPDKELTRAQFCKMAVYAMDGSREVSQYDAVTIFPDVKPSHWASGFINMAARRGVISGYPDGNFKPNQSVTAVQAVTILLRLLGYKDSEIGGVWPQSYMAVAENIGLTDGTGITGGHHALTRAQAAKLFLNLLQTETKAGGSLYTLSDTVTLSEVDGGRGTMTAGGTVYDMVKAAASSSLVGAKGRVVLNGSGKALTFLPTIGKHQSISNAAIIIYADGDTSGLSALAGSSTYSIYKNGLPAEASDLCRNDVAVYSAETNSILVCDTRVTVYYQDCRPNPAAPTTVTALDHEFTVLPTAMDSVAAFKPGDTMTLLLTADGQIAGAAQTGVSGNAVGIVSAKGAIQLLCGNTAIDLDTAAEDSKYYGQVVRISSGSKNGVNLSILSGNVPGDFDVTAKTLAGEALAENVRIYDGGEQVTFSQLNSDVIKGKDIDYIRVNWKGDVDLIVLNGQTGDVVYGRVVVERRQITDKNNKEPGDPGYIKTYDEKVGIETGDAKKDIPLMKTPFSLQNGSYVTAVVKNGSFTRVTMLDRLAEVSPSSWIGKAAVTYGGRTYTVASDVNCYNANTGRWMTLDEALAYAGTLNLYVEDQVVRVAEIKD